MENSSVNIASGVGVVVDVITTEDNDVRQVVVLGDYSTSSLCRVDPTTSALLVSSLGATTASVTGTVGVSGYDSTDVKITLDGEAVPVTDNGGSLTVDGTVSVNTLPAGDNNIGNVDIVTQPALASGTDSITAIIGNAVPITDNGGSLTVDGTVSVNTLPAGDNNIGNVDIVTQPALASGTDSVTAIIGNAVSIFSLPALASGTDSITAIIGNAVPITDNGGSLTVDGTVTVNTLPAGDNNIGNVDIVTQPALASGTDSITAIIGNAVPVTDNGGSLTVDGTVTVGSQPALASGTDSITAIVGNAVPVTDNGGSLTVDGTVTVNTLPAGDNNIGNVDIVTQPALASGTDKVTAAVDHRYVNGGSFVGGSLPIKLNSVGITSTTPVPVGHSVSLAQQFMPASTSFPTTAIVSATAGQTIRVYGAYGASRNAANILLEFCRSTGAPNTSVPSSDAFLYVAVPVGDTEGYSFSPHYITLSDNEDLWVRAIVTAPTANSIVAEILYEKI